MKMSLEFRKTSASKKECIGRQISSNIFTKARFRLEARVSKSSLGSAPLDLQLNNAKLEARVSKSSLGSARLAAQ